MKKITETRTYTFNDINVTIRINYIENKISIVDPNNGYRDKQFIFCNRGVEYMNGWLNILEAMKSAIKEAKKDYEAELAEQTKLKANYILTLKPTISKKKK